jgi:hypothetical protein
MQRFELFFANLLIVVVLYSNAAVILNYPLAFITPGLSLPLPEQLNDLFSLYGVFESYETTNQDIEIYGITPSTPNWPKGEIVKLNTADYFPFSRGEILLRGWVTRHSDMQGGAGQGEAFAALAAKIRGRYNRLHPTAPLKKIVIVLVEWERSLEGYEALKSNEELTILHAD